jgi:hypothetical protein
MACPNLREAVKEAIPLVLYPGGESDGINGDGGGDRPILLLFDVEEGPALFVEGGTGGEDVRGM